MDAAPQLNPDPNPGVARPDPNPLHIQELTPPRTRRIPISSPNILNIEGAARFANQDLNIMPRLHPRIRGKVYVRVRDFRGEAFIRNENPNDLVRVCGRNGDIHVEVAPGTSRRRLINAINTSVRQHRRDLQNRREIIFGPDRREIVFGPERHMYRHHVYRIYTTKRDSEDRLLDLDTIRLPLAPKKGRELAVPTKLPDRPSQNYEYRPSNDPAYNEDVRMLKEQRAAKKLRKKNRAKRLHPVSRKGLFKEADSKIRSAATSTSGSVSDERDDSIGVEGWEDEGLPLKDIPWEN